MTVDVRYLDNARFEAETRGHKVICDQPLDNGGADTGMTPPEFLLVSLATCAGFYAAQYLRTRQLPTAGLVIRIEAEKEKHPARLDEFVIHVAIPELDDRHREGVLRAVKSCLIHNTLLRSPRIAVELEPVRASAAV